MFRPKPNTTPLSSATSPQTDRAPLLATAATATTATTTPTANPPKVAKPLILRTVACCTNFDAYLESEKAEAVAEVAAFEKQTTAQNLATFKATLSTEMQQATADCSVLKVDFLTVLAGLSKVTAGAQTLAQVLISTLGAVDAVDPAAIPELAPALAGLALANTGLSALLTTETAANTAVNTATTVGNDVTQGKGVVTTIADAQSIVPTLTSAITALQGAKILGTEINGQPVNAQQIGANITSALNSAQQKGLVITNTTTSAMSLINGINQTITAASRPSVV